MIQGKYDEEGAIIALQEKLIKTNELLIEAQEKLLKPEVEVPVGVLITPDQMKNAQKYRQIVTAFSDTAPKKAVLHKDEFAEFGSRVIAIIGRRREGGAAK